MRALLGNNMFNGGSWARPGDRCCDLISSLENALLHQR
jgi:hypothetical protein